MLGYGPEELIGKPAEYAMRVLEPASVLAGTETALIVEDEDAVRNLVRNVLVRDGYEVLEARRPSDALRISEQHQGPIHLLLTDVVLPQMSGQELAHRISSGRRETKMLFMSGYTAEAVAQHGMLKPGAAFLEKPISPSKVAFKVREVFGEIPKLDV